MDTVGPRPLSNDELEKIARLIGMYESEELSHQYIWEHLQARGYSEGDLVQAISYLYFTKE